VRVRLFGHAGDQGAEGGGLPGRPGQLEPGDDHDRSRVRRRDYVEPITPEIVAKIIAKERPDALLPTMGGQTALNSALALYNDGTLEKYGVQMIGADADAIDKGREPPTLPRGDGQDRARKRALRPRAQRRRGVRGARAHRAALDHPSQLHARRHRRRVAYNRHEFETIVRSGLDASPTTEVLIEESLLG
jgi:carbamoyl-phosphate synthase large subunit